MTRSLACRLHLRLLVMVMSGVILVPKVIHAYNISRNNNVRPFCYKRAPRFSETNALIPFFRSIVLPACCVCLRRLTVSRLTSMLILTMVQLLGTGWWI